MRTLADYRDEYVRGLVSEEGFGPLLDAENYGHIVSINALEGSLALLLHALRTRGRINLFQPPNGMLEIESESNFAAWCETNFPSVEFARIRSR